MQATTQTRLHLSEEAQAILQRYGELYGMLKRKLCARAPSIADSASQAMLPVTN